MWCDVVCAVLSLDGGGVRGLVEVEVLQAVVDVCNRRSAAADAASGRPHTPKRIDQLFDLICGTSTGGRCCAVLCCAVLRWVGLGWGDSL